MNDYAEIIIINEVDDQFHVWMIMEIQQIANFVKTITVNVAFSCV